MIFLQLEKCEEVRKWRHMYNNSGSWIERGEERQVVVGVGCGGCYREDGPEKLGGQPITHGEIRRDIPLLQQE